MPPWTTRRSNWPTSPPKKSITRCGPRSSASPGCSRRIRGPMTAASCCARRRGRPSVAAARSSTPRPIACSTPWRIGSVQRVWTAFRCSGVSGRCISDLDATSTAQLAAIGVVPMTPADALAVGMSKVSRECHRVVVRLRSRTSGAEGLRLRPPDIPAVAADTAGCAALRRSPLPVADSEISGRLLGLLAAAIGEDRAENIDITAPMVAIGLDSLQALELRRRVKIEFNHDLEVSDLLGGASIADVLAKLGG